MIVRRESSNGSNDLNVVYRPCKVDELLGNETSKTLIKNALDTKKVPHTQLFIGDPGCVDYDTEFLSAYGWKKIGEYSSDDEVLQYNLDGSANFVKPLAYIKRKSDSLNIIQTKYGVDQCLSLDHRVVYFNSKGEMVEEPFCNIKEKHNSLKSGFSGKFKTIFKPNITTELPLSDSELRVQVMVIADANFPNGRQKCCLNLKKQRKIERARLLLRSANISYDEYNKDNGYTRFYFVAPIDCKEFMSTFYRCSLAQLETISDEVLKWDGNEKYKQYYSTSKISADFIQYVFASVGIRSTIYYDNHRNKTCYVVSLAPNPYIGIKSGSKKPTINIYKTIDGYEYCFTVPSSYLVLRRNNKIFITGNCGKTTAARIVALGLNCETNGYGSDPCLSCQSCKSIMNESSIDVREINVGQSGGKDFVDSVVRDLVLSPFNSRYKVIIFDEAHELTTAAKDLLLKPTESGYDHVYFMFSTNQPDKLRSKTKDSGQPFLDRCSIINFGRIEEKLIKELLVNVCEFEGFPYNMGVISLLVEESQGVPRNALTWLNQIAIEGSWLVESAKEICGLLKEQDDPQVLELCRVLRKGSFKESISIFEKIKNVQVEGIRIAVSGFFVSCLKRATGVDEARMFSKIIDVASVPIYEQGKLASQKFYNCMFKITDIINDPRRII